MIGAASETSKGDHDRNEKGILPEKAVQGGILPLLKLEPLVRKHFDGRGGQYREIKGSDW